MRPKVKYAVIYRHRNEYSISVMCKFFEVSRSGYYDYTKRLGKPEKDADLAKKIQACQDICDKTYGYRIINNREDYEKAICALYRDEVIPMIDSHGLCGAVFTQISDVEDEVNGFITYDRKVVKINEETMLSLAGELKAAFAEKTARK